MVKVTSEPEVGFQVMRTAVRKNWVALGHIGTHWDKIGTHFCFHAAQTHCYIPEKYRLSLIVLFLNRGKAF